MLSEFLVPVRFSIFTLCIVAKFFITGVAWVINDLPRFGDFDEVFDSVGSTKFTNFLP